jgi:hypothetical protein
VYGRNFRCADVEKGTPLVVQMLGEAGGGRCAVSRPRLRTGESRTWATGKGEKYSVSSVLSVGFYSLGKGQAHREREGVHGARYVGLESAAEPAVDARLPAAGAGTIRSRSFVLVRFVRLRSVSSMRSYASPRGLSALIQIARQQKVYCALAHENVPWQRGTVRRTSRSACIVALDASSQRLRTDEPPSK